MEPTIEVLYFDSCRSLDALLARLDRLLAQAGVAADIELRRVESAETAEQERFLGSPTLRINGRDVDSTAAQRIDYGLKCRLYATDDGLHGTPPDAWILDALDAREHAQR